jgi:hypothetical protein
MLPISVREQLRRRLVLPRLLPAALGLTANYAAILFQLLTIIMKMADRRLTALFFLG